MSVDQITMFKTDIVPTSAIKHSDIVVIDGIHMSVGRDNIKHCDFMGITIFGDCFMTTGRMIERTIIPLELKDEFKK